MLVEKKKKTCTSWRTNYSRSAKAVSLSPQGCSRGQWHTVINGHKEWSVIPNGLRGDENDHVRLRHKRLCQRRVDRNRHENKDARERATFSPLLIPKERRLMNGRTKSGKETTKCAPPAEHEVLPGGGKESSESLGLWENTTLEIEDPKEKSLYTHCWGKRCGK